MIDQLKTLGLEIFDEVVEIRRTIHANPELAFEEVQTAQYISSKLTEWGIEHQTGVAKTGIVALVKGQNPTKNCIALRADMDALPITEANDVDYKSKNEGKMHACGHDVHSACLLGVAKILNQFKDQFEGTIKLIFQPSEEKLPGGAKVMIAEGVLKNPKPSCIIAQHVYTFLPVGTFGFIGGPYMASADEIYITIKGKGGHAAMPHQLVDPVLISAHIITALQQLISRNTDPFQPAVLSFGKVIADGATNIIPNEVTIAGTLRAMNENLRYNLHQKIEQLCVEMAQSMGGAAEVDLRVGYPCLNNHPALADSCITWAKKFVGDTQINLLNKRMGAEDFAYYSQEIPACFYRMGIRNEAKNITSGLHTPTFNIDEDALKTGPALMAYLAIQHLSFFDTKSQ